MANKKKELFLKLFEKNPQKNVATKLEGGGGGAHYKITLFSDGFPV